MAQLDTIDAAGHEVWVLLHVDDGSVSELEVVRADGAAVQRPLTVDDLDPCPGPPALSPTDPSSESS